MAKRNTYGVDEELEEEFKIGHLIRLGKYIKPHRGLMIKTVLVMILCAVMSLIGPYILKETIDRAIPENNIKLLLILALIYLFTIFICSLCVRQKIAATTFIGNSIIQSLRTDCFVNLQKLPFTYYDSRPHGKILIRVVNYVNSLSDLLSNGIIDAFTNIFSLIFIIIFMFSLSIKFTLYALAFIPFLILGVVIIKNLQRRAWQDQSRKNSNLTAYMAESLQGMKVTQSFVREEKNFEVLEDLSEKARKSFLKAIIYMYILPYIIDILAFGTVAVIYLTGFYFPLESAIQIGLVTAFISYVNRFWQPIIQLGNFYNQIINAMAYLERVFETIDEVPSVVDQNGAYPMPCIKGDVEFRDVCFGYDEENLVLKDMNFTVKTGESIALVGPTGAGKTTVINLLSRFYNLTSGRLLIDGINISEVTLKSLRSQMGVMLQDTFIFSGTIADNIRYSKLDATDEEVVSAAKTVRAHDFIKDLENGYDTQVNERGSRLSVGQRQLISFARALLADPKILILDEATSSIDTETEKLLQDGLKQLLKGRTSFIIAHRLSTIKDSSRIMVIDNKNIYEQGSHDELIAKKGAYYQLYNAQYSFMD